MSVCKAVISGIALRDVQKRFTNDNLAVADFVMNIDEVNETPLRVQMYGKLAETAESLITKGTKVVVDGRLMTYTAKGDNGEDKKLVLLRAQSFDVMGKGEVSMASARVSEPVDMDYLPDEEPDMLIGDEEIPF